GAPTVHLIGLNFINGEAIGTWPQTAGGAIFNSSGTLTIEACTLANNTAGTGGAIRNQGTMIIERSTVANNSSSGDSGGIFTEGPLTLKQATLTDNTAGFAGGIWRLGDDPLTLENTILTGDSSVLRSSSEIAVVTNGVNFFSSLQDSKLTEGPSVLVGADPMLASLGDHGGPTLTRPPLPNSPLIDAGGSSPHATDQRGFPRPIGQRADIGSVEWGGANTFSTWALEMLGDATASFTGDSDGDTDANGLEFGVGADGSKSDANSNRKPLLSTNPSGGFDITFGYRPGATGLCYILERSHAVGGYSEIYRFENESHTFISGEVMVASDANDPTKLTVTDKLPMEPRSFYRLRIVKK
ncbi:right-handed parallel beta-helix repeat-containing protein, partial [Verrucomicrobiales bacterium]|nr:right-handed parallel beta-helix repeat-containing protein [Verrucomicrobiales bacterium]